MGSQGRNRKVRKMLGGLGMNSRKTMKEWREQHPVNRDPTTGRRGPKQPKIQNKKRGSR